MVLHVAGNEGLGTCRQTAGPTVSFWGRGAGLQGLAVGRLGFWCLCVSVEGWMWSVPGRLPLLAPWKEVVVGLCGRGEVLGARCSCLQELNQGWGRPFLRRA